MCAIYGFYANPTLKGQSVATLAASLDTPHLPTVLRELAAHARQRGRDGHGIVAVHGSESHAFRNVDWHPDELLTWDALDHVPAAVLANVRAAPTTEWRGKRSDLLQPYYHGGIWAVHNGTIANDKEYHEYLSVPESDVIDSMVIPVAAAHDEFHRLVGSQATALYVMPGRNAIRLPGQQRLEPGQMALHRDFRPLAAVRTRLGVFFASKLEWLTDVMRVQKVGYQVLDLPAHSTAVLLGNTISYGQVSKVTRRAPLHDSAVVILSGGLDSTVCAAAACQAHSKVTIAHFHYGCRAESQETKAVQAIAERLRERHPYTDIDLQFFDLSFLKTLGGSALTDTTSPIASGETGAEYAHEWVPFRNGLMLSMVAAYCDRHKVGHIYLGANLEEAGAYGDNEVEFFEHFEKALSIGSQSRPRIHLPVGNLMKHEIVKFGQEIGAPLDLSYSCYHGREKHCGNCGPCYMRRKAFEINGLVDPVAYEDNQ